MEKRNWVGHRDRDRGPQPAGSSHGRLDDVGFNFVFPVKCRPLQEALLNGSV